MLYCLEKLIGMSLGAEDGEIGEVKDVYFDDRRWAVRYLVVDTGNWLAGRKVLISPVAVRSIDWDGRVLRVNLGKQQIKDSPDIDTDKPVSRQHELDFLSYYGYPDYFGGSLLWGATPYPWLPAEPVAMTSRKSTREPDAHLCSAKVVNGYQLQALDDSIGHMEDFLVEDGSWAIRYLVVNTSNWWAGRHVVIPPQWITHLDWANKVASIDVTRVVLQEAPEYDPNIEFSREGEARLYNHYARPAYWE